MSTKTRAVFDPSTSFGPSRQRVLFPSRAKYAFPKRGLLLQEASFFVLAAGWDSELSLNHSFRPADEPFRFRIADIKLLFFKQSAKAASSPNQACWDLIYVKDSERLET